MLFSKLAEPQAAEKIKGEKSRENHIFCFASPSIIVITIKESYLFHASRLCWLYFQKGLWLCLSILSLPPLSIIS